MTDDLKSKLQQWKSANPSLDVDTASRAERERAAKTAEVKRQEALRKAARTKDEAAREAALSDDDLFRRAVTNLGDGSVAILKKYDDDDPKPARSRKKDGSADADDGADVGPDGAISFGDAQLFLDAVSNVPRVDLDDPGTGQTRKTTAKKRSR